MKKSLLPILLLTALACAPGVGQAEKADRNKPMNIEADALRHDELKQTSVFTGRVVMTKGSIVLRGARLDVRQDADGYQQAVVIAEPGKLAYYRSKREGVDVCGQSVELDQAEMVDGVMHIPVNGPIGRGLGAFEKGAGAIDVGDIWDDVEAADALFDIADEVLGHGQLLGQLRLAQAGLHAQFPQKLDKGQIFGAM